MRVGRAEGNRAGAHCCGKGVEDELRALISLEKRGVWLSLAPQRSRLPSREGLGDGPRVSKDLNRPLESPASSDGDWPGV